MSGSRRNLAGVGARAAGTADRPRPRCTWSHPRPPVCNASSHPPYSPRILRRVTRGCPAILTSRRVDPSWRSRARKRSPASVELEAPLDVDAHVADLRGGGVLVVVDRLQAGLVVQLEL